MTIHGRPYLLGGVLRKKMFFRKKQKPGCNIFRAQNAPKHDFVTTRKSHEVFGALGRLAEW